MCLFRTIKVNSLPTEIRMELLQNSKGIISTWLRSLVQVKWHYLISRSFFKQVVPYTSFKIDNSAVSTADLKTFAALQLATGLIIMSNPSQDDKNKIYRAFKPCVRISQGDTSTTTSPLKTIPQPCIKLQHSIQAKQSRLAYDIETDKYVTRTNEV